MTCAEKILDDGRADESGDSSDKDEHGLILEGLDIVIEREIWRLSCGGMILLEMKTGSE